MNKLEPFVNFYSKRNKDIVMNNKLIASFLVFSASAFLAGCTANNKSISLNGPENNAVINIENANEKAYIDAMHTQEEKIPANLRYAVNDLGGDQIKIKDYYQPYTGGKGINVELGFNARGFNDNEAYCYHISENPDFSDERKIISFDNNLSVHSLKSHQKYYWKVSDVDEKIFSSTKTFTTSYGWRFLNAGYITNNIRDLGGHKVKGNKIIKQGYIYRGCELNIEDYDESGGHHTKNIDEGAIYTFKNIIKIGTEIDLRGVAESNGITSSNMGWSVAYHRQSIGGYGALVKDTSQNKKIKAIFEDFLAASEDSSVYFHCWGGADRTGSIAFLLGASLGMSYTDLIIDYELTSFSYNLREHDNLGEHSDFPSLITGLKEVTNMDEENPDLQTMVNKYLVDNVGLTTNQINELQNKMLEEYHE